jgi:ribosomal protein S1
MTIYNKYLKENITHNNISLGNLYKLPSLNKRLVKAKIKENILKSKTITLDCGLKTSYKALPYELNNLRIKNRVISTNKTKIEDTITLQFNGVTPSDDVLLSSPQTIKKDSSDVIEIIQRLKNLKRTFLRKKIVKGRILKPVRGGFSVAVEGFVGFLPNSHLIKERSPSLEHWTNKTKVLFGRELSFRILS